MTVSDLPKSEGQEPYRLIRAVGIVVKCMLHGISHMRGGVDFMPLGHGKSYVDINAATCDACQTTDWLHLVIEEDKQAELEVTSADFREAMMATLAAEEGVPLADQLNLVIDEEAPDETAPDVPAAEPVRASGQLPVFKRPTLGG
jgi:hypothetical protein